MSEIPVEALSLRLTAAAGKDALPPAHPRSRRMRLQLLAVLGLSGTMVGCFAIGSNCPEYGNVVAEGVYTLPEGDESCPSSVAIEALEPKESEGADLGEYQEYYSYNCETPELSSQDGQICTYTVVCEEWNCCGYGRPYLDESGSAVAAGFTESEDWSQEVHVATDALDDLDRAQLTAWWLKNAAAEHSSVAGFHRFALDLLAHGAPPELVRRAGEAAAQEITHAVDCFALASVYGGKRMGPQALDLGTAAPVARSLAELAAWTVRDGAVGETIAAYLAAEALEQATDPEVRRSLQIVVRDETAHAELAWETLAWALRVGGDEVRDAIRAVFATVTSSTSPPERSTPGTRAHGMLSAEQRDAAARRCIEEVLRPVMASLLSQDLAA